MYSIKYQLQSHVSNARYAESNLPSQRDTQTAIIADKTLQMESQTFMSIRMVLYICRLVTMGAHNARVTD